MDSHDSQQVESSDSDASNSRSASPNTSPGASQNNVAPNNPPTTLMDNDIYDDKSNDSGSDKSNRSDNGNVSDKSHESGNDEGMAEKSSESDDDDGQQVRGTTTSLFGEELSSSDNDDDNENDNRKKLAKSIDSGEEQEQQSDKYEDDEITGPRLYSDPEEGQEEAEELVAPTRIDLEMARCRSNLGREGPLFVKFPNFLSVDTKPFDAETYEDEAEDDINMDEEGRTRLKLKIENTIRWRMKKNDDGTEVKESNAKIVKWSDGTMSLYLGGEIFDVEKQKVMDHNHLFIRQGAGLQAQAVFTEKLVFRPHSTETMTHRKMTMNMADKSNKAQKVKVIGSVGDNPESQKQELIRKEEERLRASARRESQQRKMRDRPRTSGLSSGFLEGYESDEGNGESLAAIKRKYQSNYRNLEQSVFGSSSDEEETEAEKAKRIGEAKIDSDESASSSDLDTSHQKHAKRKIVIDEDDDEED